MVFALANLFLIQIAYVFVQLLAPGSTVNSKAYAAHANVCQKIWFIFWCSWSALLFLPATPGFFIPVFCLPLLSFAYPGVLVLQILSWSFLILLSVTGIEQAGFLFLCSLNCIHTIPILSVSWLRSRLRFTESIKGSQFRSGLDLFFKKHRRTITLSGEACQVRAYLSVIFGIVSRIRSFFQSALFQPGLRHANSLESLLLTKSISREYLSFWFLKLSSCSNVKHTLLFLTPALN